MLTEALSGQHPRRLPGGRCHEPVLARRDPGLTVPWAGSAGPNALGSVLTGPVLCLVSTCHSPCLDRDGAHQVFVQAGVSEDAALRKGWLVKKPVHVGIGKSKHFGEEGEEEITESHQPRDVPVPDPQLAIPCWHGGSGEREAPAWPGTGRSRWAFSPLLLSCSPRGRTQPSRRRAQL